MQKKAQFYILNQSLPAERYLFVCRLTEKAFSQKRSIYIHCDSEAEAQLIDGQLWHFSPTSFLPHTIALSEQEIKYPILIGHTERQACSVTHRDVLINLAENMPSTALEFNRVVEIAHQNEALLAVTREHYAKLNQFQFEIATHKL